MQWPKHQSYVLLACFLQVLPTVLSTAGQNSCHGSAMALPDRVVCRFHRFYCPSHLSIAVGRIDVQTGSKLNMVRLSLCNTLLRDSSGIVLAIPAYCLSNSKVLSTALGCLPLGIPGTIAFLPEGQLLLLNDTLLTDSGHASVYL